MKPFRYSLSFIFLAAQLLTYAATPTQDEKKKTYEKTFKVDDATLLDIENKYGRVEVNTWSKSEFEITVEVIVKGKSEKRADQMLNSINVSFSQSGSNVYCKTKLSNQKNSNGESFEINYTVYMPETNPLSITNSFGDVSMGDRLADLYLDVSYGGFRIGKATGDTNIKLSFGKGSSAGQIEKGLITVKYSDLELKEAGDIELNSGFSDVELGEVDRLELEAKYGDVQIESANYIEADVQFSGFEIETLKGSLELEASYVGDFTIERLESTFTLLDIEGKFSSYEIGLAPGLNANIEAEFSFASMKIDSDVTSDFYYRVKESNKSSYKGTIGEGDPDKWIKIKSGYGSAKLKLD